MKRRRKAGLTDDPLWYKDAIIYELHVRGFYDSDGDGVGDFRGLAEKLDYIQQLGITAIWLLPFCKSPLRDEGYDVSDYFDVNPMYGSLDDFERFLKEAHRRGIRVITELPVNHTSDQHAWFQRARKARKGSRDRDFYVWSDAPDRYLDARIIFKDFEHSNWSYDNVAGAYYWHRFYAHQPDLNFDNPAVRKAVHGVLDFWFQMGVDGMRLDAVPYLFEREGTDCENLPETHEFLKQLRSHVDAHHKNKMLLAEANQWPEDAAFYFGDGDECHMNFHFPLMPRLFMSLHMEDRYPILDILEQTPTIPDVAQWGLFLRNHDELTLEMVTDEERDYMYRVYAENPKARINLGIRRRLAPLLGNSRRRIELLNALLLSLPGTPVIYYGDEIGMGDNIYLGDRDGVRTPMQWSSDRNAGFSMANPQSLYLPVITDPQYHYATINVENQGSNPQSLMWWMRRIIALRKRFQAFGRGTIQFLTPENRKILAFVRSYGDETILVVANLSRFAQATHLDLHGLAGKAPVELFGRTEFPTITEAPYFLSLGPHAFYWFSVETPRAAEINPPAVSLPSLEAAERWEEVLEGSGLARLERSLPRYFRDRRWFGGKAKTIEGIELTESVPVPIRDDVAHVGFWRVTYTDSDPDTYLLPLAFVSGAAAAALEAEAAHAIIAKVQVGDQAGVLYDAAYDPDLGRALLGAIEKKRALASADTAHVLRGFRTRSFAKLWSRKEHGELEPHVSRAEQSNTSVLMSDRLILKLYRRLEDGTNPDLELGVFLSQRARFPNTPQVAGHIDLERGKNQAPMTIALLQEYVANEGDSWQFTLDEVERFLERAHTQLPHTDELEVPPADLVALVGLEPPVAITDIIGPYRHQAELLGQRTAEMHLALASEPDDPDFTPDPFSPFYRRSLYQSMRNLTTQAMELLRKQLPRLPAPARDGARRVAELEKQLIDTFQDIMGRKLGARRVRIHGDYHLGQVLYTGRDFVIIDFEGEPIRSLSQRRLKRSPLRDVAGMLRSFHYAVYTGLQSRIQRTTVTDDEAARLETWVKIWYRWVGAAFLQSYLKITEKSPFLGDMDRGQISALLRAHLIEKAIYELTYELNNRPTWVPIPVAGILQITEDLDE
jgi:maltose alpha-D-glucosyltransferase / alpha-amylase